MFQVFFFCSLGSALGFTTSELAVCVTELYSRNQGSKPSTADQWYLSLSESIEMQTALISRHPHDAKKVSVIEGDRLLERFSLAATRGVGDGWPLTGACPANNKYSTVLEIQKTKERGNKESKDSCKAKASKQTSQIRLRNSLPVYFFMGTLQCLCLG